MIQINGDTTRIDPRGRYDQKQTLSLLGIGRPTLWKFIRCGRITSDGRGVRKMFGGSMLIKFVESFPLNPMAVAVTKISDC